MNVIFSWILAAALVSASWAAQAGLIADSASEFSSAQGQGSWLYGYYNQSADVDGNYAASDFALFDSFNASTNVWRRSVDGPSGQVTGFFLSLGQAGGHPSGIGPSVQTEVIWSVRRYVSEVAGPISIAFDVHKENVQEPRGGGITAHIFVNGIPLYTQFVANLDAVGYQGVLGITAGIGDVIDFAIDPTGVPGSSGDDLRSARADGTIFLAAVRDTASVPAPSTVLLLVIGCAAYLAGRARRV